MQRLPQIAIALAAIAVVMVGLAIYVVSTRDSEPTAVTTPPDATLAPPVADSPASVPSDDAMLEDALPPGACVPCDDKCSIRCSCKDGATTSSFQCSNACCVQPANQCAEDCRKHGGVR